MFFPFPFYFLLPFFPLRKFAFVLCCHIIFAVCLLFFVSLRVKASLPLVTIAFIIPSLILASPRATKQGNIDIYIYP